MATILIFPGTPLAEAQRLAEQQGLEPQLGTKGLYLQLAPAGAGRHPAAPSSAVRHPGKGGAA